MHSKLAEQLAKQQRGSSHTQDAEQQLCHIVQAHVGQELYQSLFCQEIPVGSEWETSAPSRIFSLPQFLCSHSDEDIGK